VSVTVCANGGDLHSPTALVEGGIMSMPILGTRGVKSNMEFVCCDCGEKYTGQQVLDGAVYLHVVHADRDEPIKSTFRCELCQEEREEAYADSFDDSW
jgi:hypothetical protein